jgi:hypothetical protein
MIFREEALRRHTAARPPRTGRADVKGATFALLWAVAAVLGLATAALAWQLLGSGT